MSSVKLKTHYSVYEIAAMKLSTAPHSAKNVQNKAKRENWESRKRIGRGGGVEYAFNTLPQAVQAEILLRQEQSAVKKRPEICVTVDSQQLWANWEMATQHQQDKAKRRCDVMLKVASLVEHAFPLMSALQQVAQQSGEPLGSLKRWWYAVRDVERADWLPLLLDKTRDGRARKDEMTEAAWEAFKADYLRLEQPAFNACYYRLKRAAKEQGWHILPRTSLMRKLDREVPKVQQVYLRQGAYAASQYYPSQRRTVAELDAMEWVNGDGYQHNVFVRWHDGSIVRPKTWIWQDVRTRKILAYRTDLSENSDSIRLSLMDLVYRYGIPKHLTIDNTRAAANKWLTGGVPNRYRFKVQEDDVTGIIPLLGIELHWTSIQFGKGRGQAKPIERAFSNGGLGEKVDKHPLLAGFYTGPNVNDKPENYVAGKDGVSYADFIVALRDGINDFNSQDNRKTEICQGKFSFDAVFERDYAQTQVRKATPEQLRYLMLMSEAVRLHKDGTFELDAGGKVHNQRNRYLAEDLIGLNHKYRKIVVKFDPEDLHGTVWVYDLTGKYLAEAICRDALAFGSKSAGREHGKELRKFVKAQKEQAKAQLSMEAKETARFQPDVDFEDDVPTEPKIIEMFRIQDGNTVRHVESEWDDDEDEPLSEFEQGQRNYIEMMKKARGE